MRKIARELQQVLEDFDRDCDTPGHVLALYLLDCLTAFERAVQMRDRAHAESSDGDDCE